MSPFVRTVKTASGATAVQIVYSNRRGSRDIEHIGSAHDAARLEVLKAAARQRQEAGQGELDLGVDAAAPGGRRGDGVPLPITSTRMAHLWDALGQAFDALGFGAASGGDGRCDWPTHVRHSVWSSGCGRRRRCPGGHSRRQGQPETSRSTAGRHADHTVPIVPLHHQAFPTPWNASGAEPVHTNNWVEPRALP